VCGPVLELPSAEQVVRFGRFEQALEEREITVDVITLSQPALRQKPERMHAAQCVASHVAGEYYRTVMLCGTLLRRLVCPLGILAICFWFPNAALCETPEKVTVCQLKADPPAYNQKLVEVAGFVTQGFEDFGIDDPTCPTWPYVWLEMGGKVRAGTMYCCGVSPARSRPEELEVEGITIPLVEDDHFREFDRLIHIPPDSMVQATILGRFFAGRKDRLVHPDTWGGYGHLGCCSLLAIQQILSVASHDRVDLDYRASAEQPTEREMSKCGELQDLLPRLPYAETMAAQKAAEESRNNRLFEDPRRVAAAFLSKTTGVEVSSLSGMREEGKAQGRVIYKWRQPQPRTTYVVVVSRPYWLTFYARDASRIAWVVIAAYRLPCKV